MLTKTLVVSFLVGLMTKWAPPQRQGSHIPEARESVEQATERYAAIAESALRVSFRENEKPLLSGNRGRLKTTIHILAIDLFEGGLRRDVHLGLGKRARGDYGRSHCLMQINIGKGTVPDPDPIISLWTGADLVGTGDLMPMRTDNCHTVGLHMMRRSMAACRTGDWYDGLSVYASGKCQTGEEKGRARLRFAARELQKLPKEWTDAEVAKALEPPPPAAPPAPQGDPTKAPPAPPSVAQRSAP